MLRLQEGVLFFSPTLEIYWKDSEKGGEGFSQQEKFWAASLECRAFAG